MKFTSPALVLTLASAALTSPLVSPRGACITQDEANQLVTRFSGILNHQGSDLGDARTTAEALIARGFEEISDSILSLELRPLGGASADGKRAYINGVIGNPPVSGITTLDVFAAACDKVIWQWKFLGVGSAQYEVKGFNVFTLDDRCRIKTLELEFNSAAWGQDTGYTFTPPSGASGPPSSLSSSSLTSFGGSTSSTSTSSPTSTETV